MKCIWKLTHLLPDYISEVKLEVVLVDIHTFYKVLPASFWKAKAERVPQQTIKALLQTLCKLRGNQLLECLNGIEDPNESEVPQFITKHCGRSKQANNQPSSTPRESSNKSNTTQPPVNVGEPTNESLVEIFRKIGSKDSSRTGILELYHFKKKYPTIDVEPFIKNASPFFQSFIERSLNQIALENEGKPTIQGSQTTTTSSIPSSNRSEPSNLQMSDSAMYMDRLKHLKEKFKTKNANTTSSEQPPSSNENENEPDPVKDPSPEPNDAVLDVALDAGEKKNFDLDDIKRRLQLIKAGKQ